jgi:oxygen-independent coproporphyrinogen-3 oxidase
MVSWAMDRSIIAAYDKPVPRYTSYPTAAQFTAAVGPAEHARWLGALEGDAAALYLHVPFCRQLCWYCACHTMAIRSDGTLDRYTSCLLDEMELVASSANGLIVGAVQWGGGTPSQLGAARLRKVGERIGTLFDRRSDVEVSLEVDPRYCDDELVEAMAAVGVTRASLGVQDFDDSVQQAINRRQSFELTAAALRRLRGAGIKRANIDLVYGLPRQSPETLARTLEQAIALAPDRFAVFAYAHVPWMKPHQKLIDEAQLPQAAQRAVMADLVTESLTDAGYVRVGLDHYARPSDPLARAAAGGTLRRTFQGYVADPVTWVVGVGASAISSLPDGHCQNDADAGRYMAALEAGCFATVRGVALDAEDRLRAHIIGQLMCAYSADLESTCRRHGVACADFLNTVTGLERLRRDGLVLLEEGHLLVTEAGQPLVRSVCAAFDRYYTGAEGRHARGI